MSASLPSGRLSAPIRVCTTANRVASLLKCFPASSLSTAALHCSPCLTSSSIPTCVPHLMSQSSPLTTITMVRLPPSPSATGSGDTSRYSFLERSSSAAAAAAPYMRCGVVVWSTIRSSLYPRASLTASLLNPLQSRFPPLDNPTAQILRLRPSRISRFIRRISRATFAPVCAHAAIRSAQGGTTVMYPSADSME